MKYKITKYQDFDYSIVYTLSTFEEESQGEIILIFEADSYEQASFIKNQFLNFEVYKPFDNCWLVKVNHIVFVNSKPVEDMPYELRTLMVIAKTEKEARKKVEKEAKLYGKPYKNGKNQEVKWEFDKIVSVTEIDFFSTIDLYKGIPVEITSVRTNKEPLQLKFVR